MTFNGVTLLGVSQPYTFCTTQLDYSPKTPPKRHFSPKSTIFELIVKHSFLTDEEGTPLLPFGRKLSHLCNACCTQHVQFIMEIVKMLVMLIQAANILASKHLP